MVDHFEQLKLFHSIERAQSSFPIFILTFILYEGIINGFEVYNKTELGNHDERITLHEFTKDVAAPLVTPKLARKNSQHMPSKDYCTASTGVVGSQFECIADLETH